MVAEYDYTTELEEKMMLQYKAPTTKQWNDAVSRAADRAIRELQGACFVCDELVDLFLPTIEYPMRDVMDEKYDENWEEQYDEMDDELRTDAPAKRDFEIDMALAVVKKLRELKRTGKSTPAPRRRRGRNRTY